MCRLNSIWYENDKVGLMTGAGEAMVAVGGVCARQLDAPKVTRCSSSVVASEIYVHFSFTGSLVCVLGKTQGSY